MPAQSEFRRAAAKTLARRLSEPRRFLQVVAGPRQVGKTTLVGQVLASLPGEHLSISADEPTLRDAAWLAAQWQRARDLATDGGTVLALDAVQKIPAWSEAVKRLWDEDTLAGRDLRVVLLGSAPMLMRQGLTESLAGRFEVLHLPHWSLGEMREAFGFTLEQYLYFGGYPGAAPLATDPPRWRRYVLDALIETTISRDVLLMARVDKPALLRQLFELGCRHSGQVLSFNKMLGQLHDAGNTTTLSHYLELLSGAGMLLGLQKFTDRVVRGRASSPKLQVLNTALMNALSGLSPEETRADGELWGRVVESAVGAHLAAAAARGDCELFYWRDGHHEVDFVLRRGKRRVALEVKSVRPPRSRSGLQAFEQAHHPERTLLVGADGTPLDEFLSRPVDDWFAD